MRSQNRTTGDSSAKAHGICRELQIPIFPPLVSPRWQSLLKEHRSEVHLHTRYISYHRDMLKRHSDAGEKKKNEKSSKKKVI